MASTNYMLDKMNPLKQDAKPKVDNSSSKITAKAESPVATVDFPYLLNECIIKKDKKEYTPQS
jgi:hypothetical protein